MVNGYLVSVGDQKICSVRVDYEKELALSQSRFDFVSWEINSKNFPTNKKGVKCVGVGFVRLSSLYPGLIQAKRIYTIIDKMGFRPSCIREVIALDDPKILPLVVLGSCYEDFLGSWQIPIIEEYEDLLRGEGVVNSLDLTPLDLESIKVRYGEGFYIPVTQEN